MNRLRMALLLFVALSQPDWTQTSGPVGDTDGARNALERGN